MCSHRRCLLFNAVLRIEAKFGFIPMTRPPPFPPLRRLAYQDESPLLGPTGDPDGWHSKDSIRIKARTLNNRHVQIDCTVSSFLESNINPLS